MSDPRQQIPPPGRSAACWLLFLCFYHFLPVPWFLAVAGGLAPAAFLAAAGLAGLFDPGREALSFAAFLLLPALVAAGVFYLFAWVVTLGVERLRLAWLRTAVLALLPAACLSAALQPIFVTGGHSGGTTYGLRDFIRVLGESGVPAVLSAGYFSLLALLLVGLLVSQHRATGRAPVPLRTWRRRRRLRRWLLTAGLAGLLAAFLWTHRLGLVIRPLAELGVAPAQYRLAMATRAPGGASFSSRADSHQWLERAAGQGHAQAALELARHPSSQEEKLRWLRIAAEAELGEAQYQLYLELQKGGPGTDPADAGLEWLEQAARNGQPAAQFDLGRLYLSGRSLSGVPKNPALARKWWEQAAELGSGRAQEELAWRYATGADGFPRDAQRAIELLQQAAEGYRDGSLGLPQNDQLAEARQDYALKLAAFEERLAQGDAQAQAQLGRELLQAPRAAAATLGDGLALLERAAAQGNPELQHELGEIYLFGRYGLPVDPARGRSWWDKALAQRHVPTMEDVAPAFQNGRFGYPVDLLKSRELVEQLVEAYRDGRFGAAVDPGRERRWKDELKHLEHLFQLAGGDYQAPELLRVRARAGDAGAQYQLGRQLLVSGLAEERKEGLGWIEKAAEGGYAEAQYRLVTYFEPQAGVMHRDPDRGVALLRAAAEQNHLPAMGALALGYQKGRYGLEQDYRQARDWYQRLLRAYDGGVYLGEIDERFIPFQRRQLSYADKLLSADAARPRRAD